MTKDKQLQSILERALSGISPKKEECKILLTYNERSLEASLIRSVADDIMRKKCDNSAIILGQVGVDIDKCAGGCKFCTFGEGHTSFKPQRLSDEEIFEKVSSFNDNGDLYGLFLMTMHDYDLDMFLNSVKIAKSIVPETTQIWANVGDSDLDAYKEMKKAGVSGVYHVCRIGEGRDTNLDPKDRMKSIDNIMKSGLTFYTCCEPIGPEHTLDELVENMFIGIDLGCKQHAAMRRTAVAGSPFEKYGEISELRLAQIVAVVALASFTAPNMTYCGVHEPNSLAYVSGSNIITAETGANPRDTVEDTSSSRGMDMEDCRRMLKECGFSHIRRGDESKVPIL